MFSIKKIIIFFIITTLKKYNIRKKKYKEKIYVEICMFQERNSIFLKMLL